MPRKRYEDCPRCGEHKVTELNKGEKEKVKKELHNRHVIHAPYEEYRIWVCMSCGWCAAVRWHEENYNPWLYRSVYNQLIDEPELKEEEQDETTILESSD